LEVVYNPNEYQKLNSFYLQLKPQSSMVFQMDFQVDF